MNTHYVYIIVGLVALVGVIGLAKLGFSTRPKVMNASGKLIDPYKLSPADLDPKIIAQTLSRTCRFWAQTCSFYSVAQHCIAMTNLFDDLDLKKWALAHEAFEGLTGMDVPTPIKHSWFMYGYRRGEERCLKLIAKTYGLPWPIPAEIKTADKRMMVTEALALMNTENYDWCSHAEPYDMRVLGGIALDMEASEKMFFDMWTELFGSRTTEGE